MPLTFDAASSAPAAIASPEPVPLQRPAGTSAAVQIALVLALALGAFGLYRTYTWPVQQQIYTVNVGALVTAKEIQQQRATDPQVYGVAVQEFVRSLKDELNDLSRRRVLVLKSDSVLTDVPAIDLTGRLATRFGLSAELAEVPAHDAQQRARYQAQLRSQLGMKPGSEGAVAPPEAQASGAAAASTTVANPASGSDGLAHLD
ncbi:hypothetical protein CRM94_17090 [Burkholderia gladioli]|uniref:Uncharacterized protein n=1 Tax=Burkholderia gladioli TaxID=28095 RepID=A0A2A7SAV0_BURGA|nr:hypothetical protein [Burkholderia gladioli]PEH40435.1 hypothetical protein CRM94_17090 [Burkholderia gladioli]